MKLDRIVIRPMITEKSMARIQAGFYTFQVAGDASKNQIKAAIEKLFKVSVLKVRVLKKPGKGYRVGRYRQERKKADLKKAIVEVKEGEKIDVFESLEQ